jgi:enterochelin esterase-like enzyme
MSQLFRPASVVLRLFLSAAIAATTALSAQTVTQSASPVPLVAAPPTSPMVQPDGSTTFHLKMPNAQVVGLHLEGHRDAIPMTKDAAGDWSVTVPGIAPEYYSYSFDVDGTQVLDPHNFTIKTSFFNNDNVFLVPGHPAMPWETADVPHGVVHHHYYHSNIVGIDSQYFVYTPPGFDPHAKTKYPVLYLLHGYSDEPSAWTMMGKANIILDNLIAQGKAKPMIVVMPWGYGDMRVISEGWVSWRDPALVRSNFSKFGEALQQEYMPMVNKQYPISEKREDHAIAGLSMGGAETLLVGLNHTDYFASIGAFSAGGIGGANFDPLFPAITSQSGAQIQSMLKVFWVACGTEDGLYQPNQAFIAWLKSKGMTPTAISTPGMHAWMVWRNNLSNFAPLLFQK